MLKNIFFYQHRWSVWFVYIIFLQHSEGHNKTASCRITFTLLDTALKKAPCKHTAGTGCLYLNHIHTIDTSLNVQCSYSPSCDIRDQRVARNDNFPDIRMLYLMGSLVNLGTSWIDLSLDVVSFPLLLTIYIPCCIYNLKNQQDINISFCSELVNFWIIQYWILKPLLCINVMIFESFLFFKKSNN
jgi:hypothetical protein